jgi:hypothetical protein
LFSSRPGALSRAAARPVAGGLARRSSRAEKPPQSLEPLDGGLAGERPVTVGRGELIETADLRAEGGLRGRHRPSPAGGGGQAPEEREADEERVVAPGSRGGFAEPPGELPPAGRRHAIEVAAGSPAGAQHPEEHPPPAAEARELGVDLGEAGAPDRIEVGAEHALELVPGLRSVVEEAEEDMGERHAETISI